jgi:WD40 repeat protein
LSGFGNDLAILDVRDGSMVRLTMTVDGTFRTVRTSADGSRIIATAERIRRELWKVPFGPDPDANGRAAVRLLDSTHDPMWAFISRDGRTVLFNSPISGHNLWTLPLDGRAAPRQITSIPGNAVAHSSLSPDGSRVAFASSATGNSDIWVQNVDGTNLRQLTNDAVADSWPIWSPDGRWIAFMAQHEGRATAWRVPADGGPAQEIFDDALRGDWIGQPAGTGTWIATSRGQQSLKLFDVERQAVVWEDRRPGGGFSVPMFSPDGRLISAPYQESRDRDAIWTFDAPTGKPRLAVRFPMPFKIYFRASWVDDGKAFVVNRYETISHIVLFDRFWVRDKDHGKF